MLPDRPGTYVLILHLPRPAAITVGRLGRFQFPAGWYAYAGSAHGAGGLAARVARHLRDPKPLRWHVDYLRAHARPVKVWYTENRQRRECAWAAALSTLPGAFIPAPRCGASDCRCPTHLTHFAVPPDLAAFTRAVGEPVSEVKVEAEAEAEVAGDFYDLWQVFSDSIAAGDDARTEEAALALGRVGDAVLPPLRDLMADADPDRRWWAARALSAVATPAARQSLITALTDPDSDVRACAAQGLGELRAVEAVDELVRCLADSSPLVSRIAADSLARIGPPATPALVAALQGGETPARAGAARALSVIQPADAVPALCAALDDPSAIVTYYAEEALERMGVGLVLVQP
jgi:Uri superfamily endonuclease